MDSNMSGTLKSVFDMQRADKGQKIIDNGNVLHVIGFMAGSEEFAVPILNVVEIVKPIEYTKVPGTPDYVLGVFNLRGSVFPLIDLRMRFGITAARHDKDTRYLVVNDNDQVAGLLIDKLTEAVRINESDVDPIPDTFNEAENLMYGIGKKEDRLITILCVGSLLKRNF